jgi:spermidine synthase
MLDRLPHGFAAAGPRVLGKPPMRPWRTLDSLDTPEGRLELRQRDERDFLITIGGRVLMTSQAHRSEDELARLPCSALAGRGRARVLLGGLGMGHTLRAALDQLPSTGRITVAEISQRVVDWCHGPLAVLTGGAIADPRVKVVVDDVARVIARPPTGGYDAIILDLYEGPHQATQRGRDPLYGAEAVERMFAALAPGGAVAIWSEEPDRPFQERLEAGGFVVERRRAGSGGRLHVIYVATRPKSGKPPVNPQPPSPFQARRPPTRKR